MTTGDTPTITGSTYAAAPFFGFVGGQGGGHEGGQGVARTYVSPESVKRFLPNTIFEDLRGASVASQEDEVMGRRLVQVFIADTDDNVPLTQALLYRGEPKFTDATDQELFFEIDIKSLLDKHNEARVKLPNKKVKERVEYLEPAKIRELKMVVVTIADFK